MSNSNLNEASRESLAEALESVLNIIKPALALVPDAEYQTSCPVDIMGNYDDVWEAAQDNG